MSPEQAVGRAAGRPPHRRLLPRRHALRAAHPPAGVRRADAARRGSGRSSSRAAAAAATDPGVPRDLETVVLKAMAQRAGRPLRHGRRAGRRPAPVAGGPADPGPADRAGRPACAVGAAEPAVAALTAALFVMSYVLAVDRHAGGVDGEPRKGPGRRGAMPDP